MSASFNRGALYAAQLIGNAFTAYAFQKAIAFHFGISVDKSVFDIAFSIPFFLVYASGLGMTHSIVVVLLSGSDTQRKPAVASARFSTLLNTTLLLLGILSIILAFYSQSLSALLAPGLPVEQQETIANLILVLLPLAFTFGISSFLSAVAVAYDVPISQEIVLLIGRIAVVLWAIFSVGVISLYSIAIIFVISTAVCTLIMWTSVHYYTPVRYHPTIDLSEPEVCHALKQFVGFMLVASIGQAASAYTRRESTLIDPTLVATLGFASSLLEPAGTILGKSAMYIWRNSLTAVRPGGMSSNGRADGQQLIMLLMVGFLTATITALCLYAAMPMIVTLLFSGGAFDTNAIQSTTHIARLMVAQLPFHIITWLALYPLLRIFKQAAALTYLVGYCTQIGFVWAVTPSLGAAGLALSYPTFVAVQAAFGVILLTWFWNRKSPTSTGA